MHVSETLGGGIIASSAMGRLRKRKTLETALLHLLEIAQFSRVRLHQVREGHDARWLQDAGRLLDNAVLLRVGVPEGVLRYPGIYTRNGHFGAQVRPDLAGKKCEKGANRERLFFRWSYVTARDTCYRTPIDKDGRQLFDRANNRRVYVQPTAVNNNSIQQYNKQCKTQQNTAAAAVLDDNRLDYASEMLVCRHIFFVKKP